MDFLRYIVTGAVALTGLLGVAGPLVDAKQAYLTADYESALPVFMRELEAKPRDGALNQWVGVCLLRTGKPEEALPYLKAAESRGIAEAPRYLAEMCP